MKITEKQLRRIIREAVQSVLSESAIDREFHYTDLRGLLGIMRKNKFNLELGIGEYESDDIRFMSLTRTRSNTHGFQYGTYSADDDNKMRSTSPNYARIEIDGRKLGSIRGARVRPFDFNYNWDMVDGTGYPLTGKEKHQVDYETNPGDYDTEMNYAEGIHRQFWAQSEDRIESKNKFIPNALGYITRIDIMVRNEEEDYYGKVVRFLSRHPEWKRLVFFHKDNKTFNRPVAEQ